MRTPTCLLPKRLTAIAVALAIVACAATPAAAQVVHAGGADAAPIDDGGVVPASYQGSGSFFNRQLGTAFRLNYHTESYGVEEGVVALGAMKVFNVDGATWFLDGQGTLSEEFGGGFNLGVGYREMVTMPGGPDPRRILGVSFWTDGQSTNADNFFTALGYSLESLGDSYDLRLNGQFPLDRRQAGDTILTSLDDLSFMGNNLFAGMQRTVIDTAHDVLDGEFAKRINDLEAWAFVGGYHIGGGGIDTEGYRAGVRGYAVPDLALSLQVTDDDVFHTNVVFAVTWFVGRTHKRNQPCGTLVDRFREPVLRNDYIVTTSRTTDSVAGNALTDTETGVAMRIVHVDSTAGLGGDGTFENPFDEIIDVNGAGSMVDDKILVHSGSVFNGVMGVTLQNGQDIFGEGRDPDPTLAGDPVAVRHAVDTVEQGLINLPETAPGALTGVTPTINGAAAADIFTMADNTTINNFIVEGGARAVVANGITAPGVSMLANMQLNNQTGDAISLTNIAGAPIIDNSVMVDGADGAGVLVDGGSDGMTINAAITNAAGAALIVQNRTGGTLTYGGLIDDVGGDGIFINNNTASTINLTNASTDVTNGIDINTGAGTAITVTGNTNSTINFSGTVGVMATGANNGINIAGNDDQTTVTFADLFATATAGDTVNITGGGTMTFSSADDTRTIENTGAGHAFANLHAAAVDPNATITVNSNIENSGGGNSVNVTNRSENDIDFNGTVTDNGTSQGILVMGNTGGTIDFNAQVTADVTGASRGVNLESNTGATITFDDVDITTEAGTGFRAIGGGTLEVVSSGNNAVTTQTGTGLDLQGMTIDAANVTFDTISVTNGAARGINLLNLDGTGTVALGGGANAGDGGTITSTTEGINVDNVDNLTVDNITINNAGAAQGVNVTNQEAGSTATFTGLNVTTFDDNAVTVAGNMDGVIIFNDLNATTTGAGDAVALNNNMNAVVTINGMTLNATGSGNAFSATGTGTLAVTGTTAVTANTGQAIIINNQTIDAANALFQTVNVTAGTGQGISLTDVTGGTITIGSGTNAGDGGMLTTDQTAIAVDNVENLVVSNVDVANGAPATGRGINVTSQAAGSTATFNRVNVTTNDVDAITFTGNTAGTINLNGNMTINAGTGDAVVLVGNGGTAINSSATSTINLGNTSGSGVHLTGTNSNVNIGADITGGTGTSVDVEDVATATFGGNITSTTGRSVQVRNLDAGAGAIAFNGNINDSDLGILLDNNTDGDINFNGSVTLNTGANNALTITNNNVPGDTTVTFGGASQLDIDTTTGDGIVFQGRGTVAINGTGNTIDTDSGIGINLDNVADFTLNNTTINATNNNAIELAHAGGDDSNVTLNNVTIASAGNIGIDIFANAAGELDLEMDNVTISAVGQQGILFDTGMNADRVDITITNSDITAGGNSAFEATMSNSNTANVRFVLENNEFTNNSATATVDWSVTSDMTFSARVGSSIPNEDPPAAPIGDNNRFVNNGGGNPFSLVLDDGGTGNGIVNLDLRDNTVQGGTVSYELNNVSGTFNLVDSVDTIADINNVGTVNAAGVITPIAPPVPAPTP